MALDAAYWLIELHIQGSAVHYYTAPNHWHTCADLATKFHDGLAAKIESDKLVIPGSSHEIKVGEHFWGN